MEFLKHILCINLDHRTDRLAHATEEFKRLGVEFERFNAIKTTAGNVGCTFSHIRCIELAKERGYPWIFVSEDDITFTNPPVFLEKLGELHESGMPWDVLIVGGNNCPPYIQLSDFAVRVVNIQTTTGYIVKSHYYDTLIDNFKTGLQCLIREPERRKEFAIDIYWKPLQQTGLWILLIPPTVIQYTDYSDIEGKVVGYGDAMLDLDKKKLIEMLLKQEEEKRRRGTPTFSMVYQR